MSQMPFELSLTEAFPSLSVITFWVVILSPLRLSAKTALFASGQFNEAAGATQFGMQLVGQDKWETVVKNYRELYGKVENVFNQKPYEDGYIGPQAWAIGGLRIKY